MNKNGASSKKTNLKSRRGTTPPPSSFEPLIRLGTALLNALKATPFATNVVIPKAKVLLHTRYLIFSAVYVSTLAGALILTKESHGDTGVKFFIYSWIAAYLLRHLLYANVDTLALNLKPTQEHNQPKNVIYVFGHLIVNDNEERDQYLRARDAQAATKIKFSFMAVLVVIFIVLNYSSSDTQMNFKTPLLFILTWSLISAQKLRDLFLPLLFSVLLALWSFWELSSNNYMPHIVYLCLFLLSLTLSYYIEFEGIRKQDLKGFGKDDQRQLLTLAKTMAVFVVILLSVQRFLPNYPLIDFALNPFESSPFKNDTAEEAVPPIQNSSGETAIDFAKNNHNTNSSKNAKTKTNSASAEKSSREFKEAWNEFIDTPGNESKKNLAKWKLSENGEANSNSNNGVSNSKKRQIDPAVKHKVLKGLSQILKHQPNNGPSQSSRHKEDPSSQLNNGSEKLPPRDLVLGNQKSNSLHKNSLEQLKVSADQYFEKNRKKPQRNQAGTTAGTKIYKGNRQSSKTNHRYHSTDQTNLKDTGLNGFDLDPATIASAFARLKSQSSAGGQDMADMDTLLSQFDQHREPRASNKKTRNQTDKPKLDLSDFKMNKKTADAILRLAGKTPQKATQSAIAKLSGDQMDNTHRKPPSATGSKQPKVNSVDQLREKFSHEGVVEFIKSLNPSSLLQFKHFDKILLIFLTFFAGGWVFQLLQKIDFKSKPPKEKKKHPQRAFDLVNSELKSTQAGTLTREAEIIKTYELLLESFAWAQLPRPEHIPPTNFCRQAGKKFPALKQDMERVTLTFCDTFYGQLPPNEKLSFNEFRLAARNVVNSLQLRAPQK